jgi:FlaA1/EpsC-like NDP-sugar epimerase
MSRFANVAFSDGSLLYGFQQRLINRQPISAPLNIKRYFISSKEAGKLCILSGLLGETRDIFFPKLNGEIQLEELANIAIRFVEKMGYRPFICEDEETARDQCEKLIDCGKWPIYLFDSDTTGEKAFEEFYTESEEVNLHKYVDIGVVKGRAYDNKFKLNNFIDELERFKTQQQWSRIEIINLFKNTLPNFDHIEKGKFLDSRM